MNERIGGSALAVIMSLGLWATAAAGSTFPNPWKALNLDGSNGFFVFAEDDGSVDAGYSVAGIGDVNGDGLADVVSGAPRSSGVGSAQFAGKAHVIFGVPGLPIPALFTDELDGTNGFALDGLGEDDSLGASVAGAGDVNGDGLGDLVLGAPGVSSFAGAAYVVFGTDAGFPASFDLTTLDGTNGFVVAGATPAGLAGDQVAGAGDLNHDGIDDLVVAAPGADAAYVVFGSDAGFSAVLDVASLDGTNGFAVAGASSPLIAASGAGDVNADGIDDLVLGLPNSGSAYVVFGSANPFAATVPLASIDGTSGFVLDGSGGTANCGRVVSGVGDVNADGVADLAVGAVDGSDGEVYVVFGSDSGFPASLSLPDLDGIDGFIVRGDSSGRIGWSISGAGDFTGDGIDDFLVGAAHVTAYLVAGRRAPFPAEFGLSGLDGSNGFVLEGFPGIPTGFSVSGAGDMNGDGIGDIVLGAPGASVEGGFYVGFGQRSCAAGTVGLANGLPTDVLAINGSSGGMDRIVDLEEGDFVFVSMLKPLAGGKGRFVLHADVGEANAPDASVDLPYDAGTTCFPFLLSNGANPLIVANNLGKTHLVGESMFYGTPQEDPAPAEVTFGYPPLFVGTVVTFQGLLLDPASVSSKAVSTTNAVTVRVLP